MELHTVAVKLEPELYEAFLSLVEDERNENEIKVPLGHVARKIVIAHLRAKGYLTTNKPKVALDSQRRGKESKRQEGDRQDSGDKSPSLFGNGDSGSDGDDRS
ncbi:MAG: hypothetical protein LBF86_08595 [Helicobacteraceae bacterium]|jgi:hypothetical protein|nr:hypothetical protein [Helicobacteraceae bacterium]